MVTLITKSQINSLNIDTIERALVFASLALRLAIAVTGDKSDLISKVRITTTRSGRTNTNLRLDVTLPFDAQTFTKKGGLILPSIVTLPIETINLTNQLNFTVDESDSIEPIIPDYDTATINTFEKYFIYYALILSASLIGNRNDVVEITPRADGFDGAEIRVKITLPLNASKWLSGKNFIDSVERVTDTYQAEFTFEDKNNLISILDNNALLTNSTLLVN